MIIFAISYIFRKIGDDIQQTLNRGKSVLLLGPRQTGKTSLLHHQINPDITYSFAQIDVRLYFEKNPVAFAQQLNLEVKRFSKLPLILVDEVQKIPLIMDVAQDFIDNKKAQFILTGSSARKLNMALTSIYYQEELFHL